MARRPTLALLLLLAIAGIGVDAFLSAWLEAGLERSLAGPELDAGTAREMAERGRGDLEQTRRRARLALLAGLAAAGAIHLWSQRLRAWRAPARARPGFEPEPRFSDEIAPSLRAPVGHLLRIAAAALTAEDPTAVQSFFTAVHRQALEMERTIGDLLAAARREGRDREASEEERATCRPSSGWSSESHSSDQAARRRQSGAER